MNQLQMFNFENQQVRILEKEGEPWFVGKDVAQVLGYSNPSKAVLQHVDSEDKRMEMIAHSQNGNVVTQTALINESGMYSLVLSSKLASAKRFKRWVTNEVLPSIRKHGAYLTPETLEQTMQDPDFLIGILNGLKEEQEKRRAAEIANQEAQEIIQQQRPKVLFAELIETSHTSILVRELAKLLKQNGIDFGEKRLFAWLRENGYLIKRLGTDYNMPTQRSMDLGLFEIKETPVTRTSGNITISKTPKVTGKGQLYFLNKLAGKERAI
ncbi:phage antirepressor [Rummeliibacillus stabekisii]|uniref:Antirepressor n=1 Tax=Rummeliibacillus stabekisii TaxID=241244 RepID=A0A143HFE7_9BACL|nr:phage antirepressor KilAC domain-containing protein [Rummeliibacillus stabekisii]AMX00445.1 antirepressor [Rummeliibacillus stabekisii]